MINIIYLNHNCGNDLFLIILRLMEHGIVILTILYKKVLHVLIVLKKLKLLLWLNIYVHK